MPSNENYPHIDAPGKYVPDPNVNIGQPRERHTMYVSLPALVVHYDSADDMRSFHVRRMVQDAVRESLADIFLKARKGARSIDSMEWAEQQPDRGDFSDF